MNQDGRAAPTPTREEPRAAFVARRAATSIRALCAPVGSRSELRLFHYRRLRTGRRDPMLISRSNHRSEESKCRCEQPFMRAFSRRPLSGPATTLAQQPFVLEEASIESIHNAIKSGQTTCSEVVQGYVARARAYNGTCSALVTADGAPIPAAHGAVRAGAPIAFPTKTVAISDDLARLRQVQRRRAGLGPHGADRVGSERDAAIRHGRRHSERGPGERARDAEYPRRTLRHLQRRVRRASVDRPAPGRRAGRVRGIPQAARRARNGRRARREVRQEPRLRSDAAVLRRDVLQSRL